MGALSVTCSVVSLVARAASAGPLPVVVTAVAYPRGEWITRVRSALEPDGLDDRATADVGDAEPQQSAQREL